MNKIDDEKIIKALINHGTISAAADYLGCTPEIISERLKDKKFEDTYLGGVYGLLEDESLMKMRLAALCTLINFVNNKEISAMERIQAADILLKYT